MKQVIIALTVLLFLPLSLRAANTQVIDIEIKGMSCKFCAYSVQKNLGKLPEIDKAEVNIDTQKAHIVMHEDRQANVEQLKEKITESGFTPVKVTISNQ